MKSEWFYSKAGQQQGPVTAKQLRQMVQEKQLVPHDLVWKEGMPDWLPAVQMKGLFKPPLPPGSPKSTAMQKRVDLRQVRAILQSEMFKVVYALTILPVIPIVAKLCGKLFFKIGEGGFFEKIGQVLEWGLKLTQFWSILLPVYVLMVVCQCLTSGRLARALRKPLVPYLIWAAIPVLNIGCMAILKAEAEQLIEEAKAKSRKHKSNRKPEGLQT